MTVWDDRILEIIESDEDDIGKVSNISNHPHIHVARSTVSRRCKKLADHDLLRQIGDGVYIITDEGKAYLSGEYNAESESFVEEGEASPTSDTFDTPTES